MRKKRRGVSMLNEQQEEKIQELASAFKKLADISNDDYFYKLLLYPDCFKYSLELEEDKEKLLEELSASWENTAIAPDKFNREQNYIQELQRKTHYLKVMTDYSSLRILYEEVLVKVCGARKNLNANIDKVYGILKRVKNDETEKRLSAELTQLLELFSILDSSIIAPLVELESELEAFQVYFYPDNLIDTFPDKFIPVFEAISKSMREVYNDMELAYVATKNMPSEDDLKDKIYSKDFKNAYSNSYATIKRVNQESSTVCSDIQVICKKIEQLINGKSNIFAFSRLTLNAGYDKVMLSYQTHANELEPLYKSTKKEFQRLEAEREEKKNSKFDIGIETLSALAYQLETVLKMAEICPRYYMECLSDLGDKQLEVAII